MLFIIFHKIFFGVGLFPSHEDMKFFVITTRIFRSMSKSISK